MPDSLHQTIREAIEDILRAGVEQYLESVGAQAEMPEISLEVPRNAEHGDWASSLPLRLCKGLKKNPFEVAEGIVAAMPASSLIEPPQVARPGFINFRLAAGSVEHLIRRVLELGEKYGQSDTFKNERVLVEFVSANPTGPLHIGHGRGAVIGDTLARIFAAAGYGVSREYYYNDAGVQMKTLGESLRIRYLQALGEDIPFLENGYKGDYMVELGEKLKAERGDSMRGVTDTQPFTDYAANFIIGLINEDLERLRIHFDTWFSETTLHKEGKVKQALDELESRGKLYEQDGAKWLASAEYGDEKDRVVIKSDGNYTYLAPDIAYHAYKFERGFTRLVNVLGADHHGYIPRLKAAIQALGHRPDQLDCVLVQMVAVERAGEAMKLSTRAGDFITLKEVLDEIGVDVTRFLFLTRTADSQMVFDFELAKDTSMDNPVYYVQYAHARCCSLMRKAEEVGQAWENGEGADLGLLTAPEEKALAHQMDRFPQIVIEAARQAEPVLVTSYLRDLATAFHGYFTAGNKDLSLRVVQENNPALTQARLTLIAALKQTFANALELLGVTPLERL
ncbi:arginine--tRNA ligase [bacterium]|nr:arginine--tRNA ligase [bacterium]